MIATARHMIWKLKAWYGAVYSYIHLVPGFVTEKMAESKKYTEELFNTLSKVGNIALLKCSSKLGAVHPNIFLHMIYYAPTIIVILL